MAKFARGEIVLVPFPFSDLSKQKLRPGVVLTVVEYGDIILCQITSKPYSSKSSLKITSNDFTKGGLPVTSYARPDKMFSFQTSQIKKSLGKLSKEKTDEILQKVGKIFE